MTSGQRGGFALLFLIAGLAAKNVAASEFLQFRPESCGLYSIDGVLEKDESRTLLHLYKGSGSDMRLWIRNPETIFPSHVNMPVRVTARLKQIFKLREGEIEISEIAHRTPHPLRRGLDEGFALLKKEECQER